MFYSKSQVEKTIAENETKMKTSFSKKKFSYYEKVKKLLLNP